ncbi:tryptophan synthase subunit alpha [Alicyclobacillaceae bacterium I2511]|nr:tryptophan synthase subunit alpha [Alicyclobacillaceae bacterium I2511]
MNRIEGVFRKQTQHSALIPFLNAGDPSLDISLQLFRSVLQAGADIVEIGIPYSDPLADGPVIQASATRSLKSGFQFPQVFDLAQALRSESDQGLVAFTYINPLLQYTLERFFADAKSAGIDGVIVPDLPYEESGPVLQVADRNGIALIPLVALTSGEQRIIDICRSARGFVYCVSSLGVTGERTRMSERVRELVERVQSHTSLPVAVGFGVSTPEQAQYLSAFADGVIVGSALIRRIEAALHQNPNAPVNILQATVQEFVKILVQGLTHPVPPKQFPPRI